MTDPATAEDRMTAIRARLDAATEGHWYPVNIEFRGQVSHSVKSNAGSVLAHTGYGPKGGSSHANAEFMAHARQDVETLLSELEAAQARLDKVERFIDQRREVIMALRNAGTGAQENGDYDRWQGHAEARRVLAETIGIELDKETGGIARALGLGEENTE